MNNIAKSGVVQVDGALISDTIVPSIYSTDTPHGFVEVSTNTCSAFSNFYTANEFIEI